MHRSGFQAFRRTGVTFISPAGIGYLCAPRSGAQTVVVVRCWELVLGALSLRWGGQRSYHHRLSEDAAARGGHDGRRLARRAGGKFMEDSMAQAAASSGRTRRHAGVESQGGKSDLRVCVTVNGQVGGGCCAANLRYLATPTAYQWHGHASFTVSECTCRSYGTELENPHAVAQVSFCHPALSRSRRFFAPTLTALVG
jgi:hypothetical protein